MISLADANTYNNFLHLLIFNFCSIAILQYLADKYGKTDDLYPKDPEKRALVNHRLAFNLSTYYRYISEYVVSSSQFV
jgi:glutathione S-transferase